MQNVESDVLQELKSLRNSILNVYLRLVAYLKTNFGVSQSILPSYNPFSFTECSAEFGLHLTVKIFFRPFGHLDKHIDLCFATIYCLGGH